MIAKLIAWAPDREAAMDRLAAALEGFVVQGCVTNLPFLQALARHPDVGRGQTSTGWIGAHLAALNAPLLPAPLRGFLEDRPFREALSLALRGQGRPASPVAVRFAGLAHPELSVTGRRRLAAFDLAPAGTPGAYRLSGPAVAEALRRGWAEADVHSAGPGLRTAALACADPSFALDLHASRTAPEVLTVTLLGETLRLDDPLSHRAHAASGAGDAGGTVRAPMAGKVLEVRAAPGEAVEEGQVLFILESMKMRFEVPSPLTGSLAELLVEPGQTLTGPEPMAVVRPS